MHRRITILLIASALVVAVHSDVLKCYMCTSEVDKGCDSAWTTNSLQPEECTVDNMMNLQRSIGQNKILKPIAGLFEVDDALKNHQRSSQNMACAKMIFDVENKEVTVRTCQTAKTEHIDPCKTMDIKLQEGQLGKMKHCDLCLNDACNSSTIVSPEIFYTLLSFFGALIHLAFYHWA